MMDWSSLEKETGRIFAKHVGTRDRVQVRQFADTHRAKKFKITPLHETYADAIRGLRVAVDGVRDIQRDDLVEEREA